MKNEIPIEKESEHENDTEDDVASTKGSTIADIIPLTTDVQLSSTNTLLMVAKSDLPTSKIVYDEPLVANTKLSTIEHVLA